MMAISDNNDLHHYGLINFPILTAITKTSDSFHCAEMLYTVALYEKFIDLKILGMLQTLPFNGHVTEYEEWYESPEAFKEAYRVLKQGGCLIAGLIDKDSRIGKYYQERKPESVFYKNAKFYIVAKIEKELKAAGFKKLQFLQTLFHDLDKVESIERPLPGYGKGSYVLIKAIKINSYDSSHFACRTGESSNI